MSDYHHIIIVFSIFNIDIYSTVSIIKHILTIGLRLHNQGYHISLTDI